MTVEHNAPAIDHVAERAGWETPNVRTIRAGEAELGGINNSDGPGFS